MNEDFMIVKAVPVYWQRAAPAAHQGQPFLGRAGVRKALQRTTPKPGTELLAGESSQRRSTHHMRKRR